jgi:threonine/homoserine/homoserine lactone efflux protein
VVVANLRVATTDLNEIHKNMMINDYLIYVTLALTVTAIPGPAVVLTIKNSLRHGYTAATASIFGNFIAMVILATLSALGLGAIIIASSTLFSAVKIAGCMYLIYLGIKVWRTPHLKDDTQHQVENKRNQEFTSMFREGFGVGLSNPKAIAFFTALFPQFIDASREFIPQFLTLIFTIEGISFIVLMLYAYLSPIVSSYVFKEKSKDIFNKLTGASFIGFGLALLYDE